MHQRFAGKAFILAFLVLILMGQAVAGDQIYVNQTGWWRDGGAFNVSSTPIQAGINNVDAPGSRVTVVDQSEHAYSISFTGGIQNGIFLDLNGSTLNGSAMPGSNGILIDGKNYLSIRNGTVIGFDAGVRIRSTISSSIEQMTIAETGSHAVAITTEDFSGSVQDFLMRDIRIIRPAGSGVRIGGYSNPLNINLTFEGITIDHPGESGIYKHNQQGIRGMTIRNTTIDTPLAYGVLIDNWGQYYRTELSDVTLDNLSVFDPGAQGIVIEQAAIPEAVNLTVRDCHVTNATGNGLFLFGGGRIGLENLTATNCSGYGLHLQSQGAATSINFGTATITGNGNGVRLLNVHNLTLDARQRVADNSGIAFTIEGVGNVTIRDLFSTDALRVPDQGFLIHDADHLTIENATIVNTTLTAVRITPGEYRNGARNLTLRGIRISRPSGHGIHIGGYANGPNIGMTFEDITIDHPLQSGIYKHDQQDMKGVTLRNVSIDTPGGSGVHLDNWGQFYRVELSDVILDKVSVNSSGDTGVNIDKASGRISLDNLTITNCSGYGLQLEPQGATTAVDFGMAHIAGNGNGVWLRNVHNVTIDARRVMDNSGIAFTLDSVGNVTIRDLFSTDTIRVPDRGFLIHEVDNLTIENATIINTTLDAVRITPGEYMNGARNLTLRGIRISRPSGHGIHIGGYANGPNIGMTFENITIDHPLGSGIYKHDQQDMKGVTLRNVSIDTPGGFGVYFDTWGQFYRVELSDVVLDDVLVSNPGSGGITILQQVTPQSINLSVMNCRVLDGESDGMSLIGGGKIVIENNTISGNTNYGLLLDENGITELNFANNTMQNNTKGIQISSIDGDLNESVIQSMNNDISLVSNSLINTFNTSFDKARASVADTSILNVFWFIDLTVVDESLNPVDGAYVTVKNTTGSTVFSGTTDSLGTVPRFALNEYAKNSTTELFHTPFLFHAEKAGETNSTLFDVDRTMAVTLILEPPQPAPVASFTANLTSGNAPLAVQFNDTSLNNPTMWNWSFGDGTWFNTTEGSLRNATRTYLDPGSYTVHLTVSNEGGSDTTLPGTDITVTQPPPPITVLTPNGGEEWQRGTTQTLEWNYSGTPGSSVMIELLQGMEVDTVITPDTSLGSGGFGTYHWTIPFNQTPGSDYRIRISSTSNPAYNDTSNASFSIGPGSPITILSPNGGEQWKQGSTQTLRWNYTGEPGSSVKVEVIKGAIVRVIAPNTSLGSDGSGFLTFTFPYSAPLGSDYLIRVTSTSNTSTTDTSDAPFSIIPPLTVLSPNGGEEWEQGSTQTIRWEYIGDPGPTVKIEALRGDTVLAVISPGTPVGTGGTGSLNLTLPKNAPLGTTYRLRISSTSNALYTDTSDAPFAVIANASSSIPLETPNGGETYLQGSEQTIQWKYTGDPGPFVKIEALRNGSVLAVITPSTPIGPGGSGSYNLTFPYATPVGSDYQVRVTSTSNPAWTDTSDGPFAIVPSITVLSPDGGEEWEQGSTHPLTWTYSGNPGTAVKIEALRGDAVLAVITPNTPIGPGMFNLAFPANTPLGNDYRIRITSTTYPGCTDTSDGFFIISAPG